MSALRNDREAANGCDSIPSLLLLCARPCVDNSVAALMLGLVEDHPDWAGLLAAAADHAVAPLLCQRLETVVGDALPPVWREQFREEFARNIRRNLFLTVELLRVLDGFAAQAIAATPYKGPALAAQAYGDVALRQFADLDIIVPHHQIEDAHRSLAALGYRSEIETDPSPGASRISRHIPGHYAYLMEESGTHVELHTESTLRYVPRHLDLAPMIARRAKLSLPGGEALTFCAEDALVLLCVHGSKHLWDQLGWIADIAALSQNARGLDWETALGRARTLGAERMVLMGAGLARDLLAAPLPECVESRLGRDATASRLIATICRRFRMSDRTSLGVFSRFAFRVRMRGSASQGLPYALRLATAPTEDDRHASPLADHFEPLYAILRPMRLARIYGWRTRSGAAATPAGRRAALSPGAIEGILAFAGVRPEDFVVDALTASGQIAIQAARQFGASGAGVVPNRRAVIEAKFSARENGVSAQLKFFEQLPEGANLSQATLLFVEAGALANDAFRLRANAAMSRGMRVVSINGVIAGRTPARETRINLENGGTATVALWQNAADADESVSAASDKRLPT